MLLTIDPKFEARIREYAEAEGLSPEVYVEHLVEADQSAIEVPAIDRIERSSPNQAEAQRR